jgi:ankyrin repeat protein
MKITSFLSRLSHSPISLLAIVTLIALACSTPAFCGEIHVAVTDGDLQKVKALLKDNPKLALSWDYSGISPLHLAARWGHPDIAELLLAYGGKANARDENSMTPLHWAARYSSKEVVALLLANKAEVNDRDNEGLTPLHWAARKGSKEVVALLLANKAEVNDRDNEGLTPLHWAARNGSKDVVALLLANKAEVNDKDNKGLTPLHWAARCGYKDAARALLAKGADVNSKVKDPEIKIGKPWKMLGGGEDAKELQSVGKGDGKANSDRGATPLHFAAGEGNGDVVNLLLAKGADVNAKDAYGGRTPLYDAIRARSKDIVAQLLAHGADVNARDDRGFTPLHIRAIRGDKEQVEFHYTVRPARATAAENAKASEALDGSKDATNHMDLTELLIAHGADVHAKDKDGRMPLDLAVLNDNQDVARVLGRYNGHE